jgi:hypothetical protein
MYQLKKEHTITDERAAKIGLFVIIPIIILISVVFMYLWQENLIIVKQYYIDSMNISNIFKKIFMLILPFIVFIIGIIIHEFVHIVPIILFSKKIKGTFKLGFNGKSFIPYCYNKRSFKAYKYAIISALPAVILGIIPLIYSFIFGNPWIWLFASTSLVACTGDFISVFLLSKVKMNSIVADHPKRIGFILIDI